MAHTAKIIRLLGLEFHNLPLREELQRSESYYDRGELSHIKTVSMDTLSKAGSDGRIRRSIEEASLVIVDDKEILTEAGIQSNQRTWEISERIFIREFLKRAKRNRRTIFLIAEQEEELMRFRENLLGEYETLQIVGQYAVENCAGEYDEAVNEINVVMPQVVLSVLPTPLEEDFLEKVSPKLSTRIWYSLGKEYSKPPKKPTLWSWLKQMIHIERFKSTVQNYEKQDEKID